MNKQHIAEMMRDKIDQLLKLQRSRELQEGKDIRAELENLCQDIEALMSKYPKLFREPSTHLTNIFSQFTDLYGTSLELSLQSVIEQDRKDAIRGYYESRYGHVISKLGSNVPRH